MLPADASASEPGTLRTRAVLKDVFGFADFRPGQGEIVDAVLAGRDVLAVCPTGSGKSLCYQLPSILRGGLTVVVSPLIALMRDQVRQLQALGVSAASLNSTSTPQENQDTHRALRDGTLRLLYIAPERLARGDSVTMLRDMKPRLLAIDEAHCISQWGHDFRPDYLVLSKMREQLGEVQCIALTATADALTRADIAAKLFRAPPQIFLRSFDRPNLRLAMQAKDNARRQLGDFLEDHRGDSGIVYCSSRKRTEALAQDFAAAGHRALPYHAGMESIVRNANQDTFLKEDGVVMFATTAFGMGIDKPDVRFVAHADLPQNIENYYQEIGRAGRDGLSANTLTLYGLDDMRLRRMQVETGVLSPERKRIERQRFNALLALCEAPRCRRQTLLAYFGEQTAPCGNCDLCASDSPVIDGTIDAQKALSAILRTGERFGTEQIVAVLTGADTEAIRKFDHQHLPTFGVGRDRPAGVWRSIMRQLYALGLITLDLEYGRWLITDAGRDVLHGRVKIELREDVLKPAARGKGKKPHAAAQPVASGDVVLLDALKALRRQLAAAQGVPAYVIFPDRTLLEIAAAKPATLDALHDLYGVGAAKLTRYGAAFLEVVKERG
jgi:ATP-dependent DNA helicase RecQ